LFVDDIFLDNQYFAVTVRSPAANCILKDIHCPTLENQYRLIRASDIPGQNRLLGSSVPLLASKELCYIGEPVAILVGPDVAKLEYLAARIVVETETAKGGPDAAPVFSIDSDNAETIVQVMLDTESFPKNVSLPKEKSETGGEPDAPASLRQEAGAADDSTADAADAPVMHKPEPVVVAGSYRTGAQEHWYSEPHGAIADILDEGVIVYTATQWPTHVKQSVAEALSLPAGAVSVKTADLGLHFDGKIWYPSLIAVHAALAAFITKRPVKLMLIREEDFLFSPKRPKTMLDFSSLLDPNGEPYETTVNIRSGFGAETFFAEEMLDSIARAAAGHYRLGHIRVKAEAVKTNLPPACPFAGFGAAQGFFALERHVAKIADTVRMDGSEWRGHHYNEKKFPADELEKLTGDLMKQCDYKRKWAAYELLRRRWGETGGKMRPMRGIGIAVVAYGDGKTRYSIAGKSAGLSVSSAESMLLASAIVELEIDRIDFSANIRCVCISVRSGALRDKYAARRRLLQNSICAFGWIAAEKLEYRDGRIDEGGHVKYRFPELPTLPPISVIFSERAGAEENLDTIGELPYCVFPAAYLEALSQACDHHFEAIPVFARDIWRIVEGRESRRQESHGEKEE
jgi:CO/xanthine dehydrogenase Mo-binding subunit